MLASLKVNAPRDNVRFSFLDFLRGFAAMAVVGYHFGGRSGLPYLVPRSYLAVDLFFVLSGFVLANAYGARLGVSLTAASFMRLRLIRLLPMLFIGTAIGAVIELGRPGTAASLSHLVELAAATVLGSLAIPIPVSTSMEQVIFPINGPAWSLMFELLACAEYTVLARDRTGWKAATATMVTAGLGLGLVCMVLKTADVGSLLSDWPAGIVRVAYSFSAGLVVYSVRERFPALRAWMFPAFLLVVFSIPTERSLWSAGLDFGVIVVVLPCLVGCAANVEAGPLLDRWSRVSGDLSYPLYAIHYPIVRAVCHLMSRFNLSVLTRVAVGLVTIAVLSIVAYQPFATLDARIRRWLTGRLVTENDKSPPKKLAF